MTEKPFLVSGRNTLIHKIRKLDLLVTNGEDNPAIIVSHKSIKEFTGTIPDKKSIRTTRFKQLLFCKIQVQA